MDALCITHSIPVRQNMHTRLPQPQYTAVLATGLLALFILLLLRRLQFNVAFFVVAAYCLYYLTLEPVAGLSWSVLVGLPLWLTATAFQQQVHKAGLWALGIHVFSWYMQVRT